MKNSYSQLRRNFIALGCPIKDVLDFDGFSTPRLGRFFLKRDFSTGTRDYNSYPNDPQRGSELDAD